MHLYFQQTWQIGKRQKLRCTTCAILVQFYLYFFQIIFIFSKLFLFFPNYFYFFQIIFIFSIFFIFAKLFNICIFNFRHIIRLIFAKKIRLIFTKKNFIFAKKSA